MDRCILKSIFILCITGTSMLYAPTGWMFLRNATTPDVALDWKHSCLATDNSGRIFVAARQTAETDCNDITVHRSLNAGWNWTWLTHQNDGGTGSVQYRSTDITTSGDTVMIIFEKEYTPGPQNRIHFMVSSDSGENWTDDVIISSGNNREARHPRIAVGSGYLYSVWSDEATHYDTFEIHFSYSTNWGTSWSSDQRVTTAHRNSWHPAISANAGAIHLAWADNRNSETNYEIYYVKSTDHGSNWVDTTRLSNNQYVSEFPDIVSYADPNDTCVHVVWQDDRSGSAGIWYRRSTDNGATWQTPTLIFADGHHPAIAADSLGLYVVFEKNSNIWYLESTNWGTSWPCTTQITNTSHADSFPDIFADASITGSDLNRHIIFKRDPTVGYVRICFTRYDTLAPAKPQKLSEQPSIFKPPVRLIWEANTERDLKYYKIFRRLLPDGQFAYIAITSDTTYADYNVQPDNWYAYYINARDWMMHTSAPSNTIEVYVPKEQKRINLGAQIASPYTIERSGYHQWGKSADSTADFGSHLKYCLTNFVPKYDYVIGFLLFEPVSDSGRVLSIRSNSYSFKEKFAVPESAQCICFEIPKKLYEQGNLELTIPGIGGEAVLSQIFIWENSKGGPQSSKNAGVETGLNLQLYPSPGRGVVTVCYELPFATEVTVEVCDCVGRIIYKKEQLQNPGLQKIELNSAEIPAGVYFVRLKTAEHKETKKVIFLR